MKTPKNFWDPRGVPPELCVCEECGSEYERPDLPGRPPDRPPLACSVGCREKLLKKTGRKVG